MPIRNSMIVTLVSAAMFGGAALPVAAQPGAPAQAYDPSPRLREVLPADVADRVLAKIAAARSRGLPAQALERTALKGAARSIPPADIERAVAAQEQRLDKSKAALSRVPGRAVAGDEIEAGAEALRQGVDGASVSELAKSAPSGRSLAVPLHVLGSLVARGLPSDQALAAVAERLQARADDAQLAQLPEQVGARGAGKPNVTGPELAGSKRPGTAGGPPAGVPANGGARTLPATPGKPTGRP
jgi:hypothetical protein